MTESYDIVIVGARCAGAALATFLAREGARVALFDRQPMPSDNVMSTHLIHPCGVDVLDELGVGERVRAKTPGTRVARFVLDETALDATFRDGRRGYCPRRKQLDAHLQDAAIAAGAALFDSTRVLDVRMAGGTVAGLKVKDRTGERDIAASLVVGADGRHSRVAQCVGASEYLGYDAERACYWSYWPARPEWKDEERHPFDIYVARSGAAFRNVFQTDDDRLLIASAPPIEIARGWKSDLMTAYRADLANDPVIHRLIEDNEPVEPIRGTIRERYYFREAAGPGWVLLGDAGHHKDFIIADGMTEALLQARSLASAIGRGTDAALAAWWRQRDIDALAMFRFAQDQGAAAAPPGLIRYIYARLARMTDGGVCFTDGLDRRISPYDAIPDSAVWGAVLDGLLAGDFATIAQFFALGRRKAQVGREVKTRATARKDA